VVLSGRVTALSEKNDARTKASASSLKHFCVESAVLDREIACVVEHGRPVFRDLLSKRQS
jgi:hypothetical protein